ncbi:MAG: methionyl-tRNA formyltransferase [Actinomycetota bacterium]|nr:methionyl-tRNA formyltransferase [Actinomycetota bacterium]
MRLVYFGSGDFSRDFLQRLLQGKQHIAATVTRPDRHGGRGRRLRPTPLKTLAEKVGLEVLQPASLEKENLEQALRKLDPDMVVVADYGDMLPDWLLRMPPKGCINVHPSLLPAYRGASPIRRAIMKGESCTGVTIILMDEGTDTGPIISQREMAMDDWEDAGALQDRLAELAANLFIDTIPDFAAGLLEPSPQNEAGSSYAPPLRKRELCIDWSRGNMDIHNQVRALSPVPGAHTNLRGRRIKIFRTIPQTLTGGALPGELVLGRGGELLAGTGTGYLRIETLQPEGRKKISASDFMRGYRPCEGERFEFDSGEDPGHDTRA